MCLPIIGGVVSGIGAAMGAAGQKASYEGQAALDKRQARIEQATGNYKAERQQDQNDRALGQARAGFAANGVGLSGSAADTVAESAQEGALDVAAIRWNSRLASDNSRYRAKMNEMNAGIAGSAAPIAFLAPTINGISTYASSFS